MKLSEYFTTIILLLLAVSCETRANDCSAGISGENMCQIAVKIMVIAARIVLFGLRYFIGEIGISPLVLLLIASSPMEYGTTGGNGCLH